MEKHISSPETVKRSIIEEFKRKKLTLKRAGHLIGYTQGGMSNLLSENRYFNDKQAVLLNSAFGFDIQYLTSGKRTLYASTIIAKTYKLPSYLTNLVERVAYWQRRKIQDVVAECMKRYLKDVPEEDLQPIPDK